MEVGAAVMEQRYDWRLTEALPHEFGRGDPFAAAVRATRMPMIVTDPSRHDNPIVFANAAFQELTGYGRAEVICRNCRFLQGHETDPASVKRIGDAVASGNDVAVDILNYRKDGTSFWNALYISPVRDADGTISYFFASQLDVTDRIDAHSQTTRQKERVEQEVGRRTADLEAALAAQKLLLHEVDHRVKNNMTMIGSILRLQLRELDPETAARLQSTMQRIEALGMAHRQLYQSEDVTRFDIGAFAAAMASELARGMPHLRILTDLRGAMVPVDHASALGIVVNEILMLMFKRVDGARTGAEIRIRAHCEGQGITLELEEVGLAVAGATESRLSRTLISRLSAQAHANVTTVQTDDGQKVTVSIGQDE